MQRKETLYVRESPFNAGFNVYPSKYQSLCADSPFDAGFDVYPTVSFCVHDFKIKAQYVDIGLAEYYHNINFGISLV